MPNYINTYVIIILGKPERPDVCRNLKPMQTMCGKSQQEALMILESLEQETKPSVWKSER